VNLVKPKQINFRIESRSILALKKYAKLRNLSLNRALSEIIDKATEPTNEPK
jgi:predicted DNA binding CopG/RHH family protein